MFVEPNAVRVESGSRRDRVRAAHRAEIVRAAWEIVREHGLAALSLRDLAARVGLRAPSLYGYFGSKHEIYDAMFREGYEEYLRQEATSSAGDASPGAWEATALAGSLRFFDFCTADPARYQLLFQRTIPGFEPSSGSWALAQQAYELSVGQLRRAGLDQAGLDLWTAVITGLVDQQISNDPGGARWRELVPRAVELLCGGLLVGDPPTAISARTTTRQNDQ